VVPSFRMLKICSVERSFVKFATTKRDFEGIALVDVTISPPIRLIYSATAIDTHFVRYTLCS